MPSIKILVLNITSWIWPVNTLLTLSFVIKLSSTKRCSHTDIRDDTIWWEDMGSREELNWLLNKWWQLDEWGTSDQPAVIKSSLGFLSKPWWQWKWECHQTKDSTSRTVFVLYKFLYISNIIITYKNMKWPSSAYFEEHEPQQTFFIFSSGIDRWHHIFY